LTPAQSTQCCCSFFVTNLAVWNRWWCRGFQAPGCGRLGWDFAVETTKASFCFRLSFLLGRTTFTDRCCEGKALRMVCATQGRTFRCKQGTHPAHKPKHVRPSTRALWLSVLQWHLHGVGRVPQASACAAEQHELLWTTLFQFGCDEGCTPLARH
jgi:hypothetical protein